MYDHSVMTYILNKAPSFITIERFNIFYKDYDKYL